MLVIERFADPIVSLPPDAFRKREPVQLRSVITGKIGSPVTIRQPQVQKLRRFPLPVEVIPMAVPLVSDALRELGFTPSLRADRDSRPYVTDEGNFILDCSGLLFESPDAVATKIDSIVGIVEHGLFLHMADRAVIAGEKQVIERKV
jgi:ribose 5-phosphate isomerase